MAPRARTAQERREAVEARRERRAAVTDPEVVMEAAAAFLAPPPGTAAPPLSEAPLLVSVCGTVAISVTHERGDVTLSATHRVFLADGRAVPAADLAVGSR